MTEKINVTQADQEDASIIAGLWAGGDKIGAARWLARLRTEATRAPVEGDLVEVVARAIMQVNRDSEPEDFGPGRVPSPYEYAMARAAIAALSLAPRVGDKAISDIAAERQRQVGVEGWTPEHDDEHGNGELAQAAACYAAPRSVTHRHTLEGPGALPVHAGRNLLVWPWDFDWWKPKDERANLVRSGALILAEIERLDRTALKPTSKYGHGSTGNEMGGE